eukprot:3862696-Rhodomonas_salina.1
MPAAEAEKQHNGGTPRSPRQETAVSGRFVPGMRLISECMHACRVTRSTAGACLRVCMCTPALFTVDAPHDEGHSSCRLACVFAAAPGGNDRNAVDHVMDWTMYAPEERQRVHGD